MSIKPTADEIASLSDYDVQILHNIVSLAEESPAPGFREIFDAYATVLEEYGIRQDSDSVYFRFLLRMGQGWSADTSLYQQFRSLLSRMGIEVSVDHAASSAGSDDSDEEAEEVDDDAFGTGNGGREMNPSRRSSFDDAQDYEMRLRSAHGEGESLRQHIRSRSFDDLTQLRSAEIALESPRRQRPSKNKPNTRTNHNQKTPPRASKRGVDRPDVLPQPNGVSVEVDDSQSLHLIPQASHIPDRFESQRLDASAKQLRYHQVAARAIRLFRYWADFAITSKQKHAAMQADAVLKDRLTLCNQALDQWRTRAAAKTQERNTELFYERMGQRAQKSRDLFLLSRAFTHWAEYAAEEAAKTSAATKIVMKSRYYNAWRELTVVNDFKARRQATSKFWQRWLKKARAIRANDATASSFRDLTTAETCYRHWFWSFCERRAPDWYENRLKTDAFVLWTRFTQRNHVKARLADDLHQFQLLRKHTIQWISRSAAVNNNEHEALVFRQRMLMLPVVESLQKELELLPVEARVTRAVRVRSLRSAFNVWTTRTQQIRQSRAVDRLRVMRNLWTQWNDRLRCQTLASQIDERVVVDALYRWVLAARFTLSQRVMCDNLKSRALSSWRSRNMRLSQELSEPYHRVRSLAVCHRARSILQQWQSLASDLGDLEDEAVVFCQRASALKSIKAWSARREAQQRLADWAKNARFYVTTRSTIRTWQDRLLASQKVKRRDAFVFLRGKVNKRLGERVFHTWQSETAQKRKLDTQAADLDRDRYSQLQESAYGTWRKQLQLRSRNEAYATAYDRAHLLQRHWNILASQRQIRAREDGRALEYLAVTVETTAAKILRQMTWRVFQLKGQMELAESLQTRTFRKHHRNMLRHWAERGRRQRKERSIADGGHELTFGEWPEAEQSVLTAKTGVSSRIPLTPGYLRTPSRRAGHKQLLLPTTPATTQVTPHRSISKLQFSRSRFSRSTQGNFLQRLAEDTRIDDIPETQSIEDDTALV